MLQTIRAIKSALLMLTEIDNFQKYLEEAYDGSFDIRIEIYSGEVVVGTVGTDTIKN